MNLTPDDNERRRVAMETMHARAWHRLNHSHGLAPSLSPGKPFHGLPRLRLWDDAMGFGSDAEPTTLTVYELFDGDFERVPVVREAVWHRMDDLNRIHCAWDGPGTLDPITLTPTIAVRDATITASHLEGLLAEASVLRVPIAWFSNTEAVTCDAGNRGFAFFSHDQPPAVLKLEWSWDVPPEWKPILEWSWRLRRFLEGSLNSPPNPP